LGRWDGSANLARVYLKEGRLTDAVAALERAGRAEPPAPRWLAAWLGALTDKQNGYLDQAVARLESIVDAPAPDLAARGFDFRRDYEVLIELGQTLFERAKAERNDPAARTVGLEAARRRFEQVLQLDSENLAAHYNLALILTQLGDLEGAGRHRVLHEKYRPDDNARDRAITAERRRNAAADAAAQSIVIYPLHRPGAPELTESPPATSMRSH
jgi:tetratricopeptide (TPR) repeat protein